MKKLILTTVLLAASIWGLMAQQDAQYTQYMYNTIAVNPAYAGSRGVLSIAALHRSQWVGLDGAPTTQTLNIHTSVSERLGLGLSIVNDEIGNGTNQDTYFDAIFSYTVPISETGKLSFGVKAGGHLLNISREHFQIEQREGEYYLTDRGSACGTKLRDITLGGEDTGGTVKLQDGDVIGVGAKGTPYLFQFVSFNEYRIIRD